MPFGPEGAPGPALAGLIRGPGSALAGLVLVAPAPATDASRDAAITIARAWVHTGRRVVLVDLGLEQPSLHEPLGVPGDEGIADHFAFGTSLERLARPVEGGAWALIPAGAYTPDPAAVLGSAEWRAILQAAAEQHTTLLLYAPADAPALTTLAATAGAVLDLGGARDLDRIRPYSVLATFEGAPQPEPQPDTPPQPEPEPRPEPQPQTPRADYESIRVPRDARTREALIADLRARQREALMQPPPAPEPETETQAGPPVRAGELVGALSTEGAALLEEPTPFPSDFPILEPPPRPGPAPAPRRRRPLLYTLIAVALLSAIAAAWHFAGIWFESRRAERDAAAVAAPPVRAPAPAPAPVLPAVDTVLGYAVALEAHQQLPDALRRVAALREAMPRPGFFIAPLVREGSLFYHVMAGPVRDAAGASALMDTLIARRHKTGGTPADVRHAPLAFLAGDYPTPDSAAARIAELQALEIPAYALPLEGPPARHRVYVGGYAGTAEAEVMGEMLRAVGQRDSLVARVGRL